MSAKLQNKSLIRPSRIEQILYKHDNQCCKYSIDNHLQEGVHELAEPEHFQVKKKKMMQENQDETIRQEPEGT